MKLLKPDNSNTQLAWISNVEFYQSKEIKIKISNSPIRKSEMKCIINIPIIKYREIFVRMLINFSTEF